MIGLDVSGAPPAALSLVDPVELWSRPARRSRSSYRLLGFDEFAGVFVYGFDYDWSTGAAPPPAVEPPGGLH